MSVRFKWLWKHGQIEMTYCLSSCPMYKWVGFHTLHQKESDR